MVAWGICMTFMGFVRNYSGLLAARWFLGFCEAGLYTPFLFEADGRFPGVQFYLSCWYRRKEFGLRSAIFFSAAALSGSFGGLLAAAIAHMEGIGGKSGWAWIVLPSLRTPLTSSSFSRAYSRLSAVSPPSLSSSISLMTRNF